MSVTAARAALAPAGPAVFLYPGQLYAGADGARVTTILGTCVAVCLWSARARAGGINHYLLARAPAGEAPGGRYGEAAIAELVQKLAELGVRPRELVGKVFGGMDGQGRPSWGRGIGAANAELAQTTLQRLGVPILTRDTGGPRGRKLVFDLATGDAWVKVL